MVSLPVQHQRVQLANIYQIKENDDGVSFNIWNPSGVTEYPYTVGSKLIVGGTTWGNAAGSKDSVATEVQKGMPKEIYPVRSYALRPN